MAWAVAAATNGRLHVVAWVYRVVLLGLCSGAVFFGLRAAWAFTIDDAGISYAYAKHLAEGLGPVAVPGGPRIEGYSNPLWVFLLVPVHWLGWPIPAAAKLLGVACFVAALGLGAAYMLRVSGRDWRRFGAAEACFVSAAALCLELAVWAPAGLENALFWALSFALLLLDAREATTPSAASYSGLAAFALSITRPEGVAYAAPLLAIKLVQMLRGREPLRQAVSAAALFLGPLAFYHVAHYLVFGELVPNTYYAKPVSDVWSRGSDYLLASAHDSGLIWALPLALIGLYGQARLKLLAVWLPVIGASFVLYSGGDWMPHGRFLSLFAPAVLVLAALGLANASRLVQQLASRWRSGELVRELAALGACCAVLLAWWRYQAPRLRALEQKGWCHFCERLADTARVKSLAARAGLPSHSLVTQDFGGPAWLADESFYPLDFLGLCDKSIVLIRGPRSRGGVRGEPRFYQYLIHEQPLAPSWILVPPNFWPGFDTSLERRFDYYPLSPRLLPRARRDSFFALHRGELVDYFPPLPSAPRPIDERLVLGGHAVFADPEAPASRAEPGARALVLLSLWPRGELSGAEQFSLSLEAGGPRVDTKAQRLDRGIDGVGRLLAQGEPLSLEFSIALPKGPATAYRLSLVASRGDARSTPAKPAKSAGNPRGEPALAELELGELAVGAALAPLERVLPRYPQALPAPTAPELRALQGSVTWAIEQRRSKGNAAPTDTVLSERLEALGESLESRHEPEQAYLSYVWATRVNRPAWGGLAKTIHRLRPPQQDDSHWLEIALLRQYYTTVEPAELARLVAFYLMSQRPLEADYFASRFPSAESSLEPGVSLRAAAASALHQTSATSDGVAPIVREIVADPLGGVLDFETPSLEGWQGDGSAFRSGPSEAKALMGQHGRGILSSSEAGVRATGSLSSPEFVLAGSLMSLLVGGGTAKSGVGVELLIEGKAVLSAAGNGSDNLIPVLWNTEPYAGKTALLQVYDRSRRSSIHLDRVLVWK